MYINFQQNRAYRSVITVHTNVFAKKIASCVNLQLPIESFKKSTLSDMHHRKTYLYNNFQQNRVSRSVKTVHTNLIAKILICINLQLAIRIFKKIKPFGHALPPHRYSVRF